MANTIEFIMKAIDKITPTMNQVKQQTGNVTTFMQNNWLKVGAATGAAAIAIEGFAKKQAPLLEGARKLANSMDMSEGAMIDLITQTSNVTFSLDDVIGVMEKGRQQGIKSAEDLKSYAEFWDLLADATGESSVAMADQSSALRAVGIAAGDEAEAISALGYIHQETTGNIKEFLQTVGRMGPDLRELGLDVDDTAALLGAMEHELGMTSRVARTEFSQAINQSEGDLGKLLEILGLTGEQFDEYKGKVKASSTVLEEHAKINNETMFTALDKIKHQIGEVAMKFSPFITQLADFAPALMAVGPAMKIFATAGSGIGKALGLVSSGFTTALAGAKSFIALAMANPLTPWIIAIGAVVAAIILIYKNWDKIVGLLDRTIQRISGWLEGLKQKFEILTKPIDWIVGKLDILKGKTESYLEKKEEERKLLEEINKTAEPYMDNLENIADIQESSAERRVEAEKQVLDVFDSELGLLDSLGTKIQEVSIHHQALVDEYTKHIEGMRTLYDETGIMTGELYEIEKQKIEENRDKLLALTETQKLTAEQRASAEQKIIDKYEEQITKLNEIAGKSTKQNNPIYIITDSSGNKTATNDPKQIDQAKKQGLDIQKLHTGGMFRAPTPGGEGFALLRDRETVRTPEQEKALQSGASIVISQGAIVINTQRLDDREINRVGDKLMDVIISKSRAYNLRFAR